MTMRISKSSAWELTAHFPLSHCLNVCCTATKMFLICHLLLQSHSREHRLNCLTITFEMWGFLPHFEFGWCWISVSFYFDLSLGGCLMTFQVLFYPKCFAEQWPRDGCWKMTPTCLSWVSLISFFLWPSLPWIIDLIRCVKLITGDYVEHEY